MGKSYLRTKVFQTDYFDDARELVPARQASVYDGFPVRDADKITVVFEDASVRFSSGASTFAKEGSLGHAALCAFIDPIHACFLAHPRVHTYILFFDKKQYVPQAKAKTQAKRRDAMTKKRKRDDTNENEDDEWRYDGVGSVIEIDKLIPPWTSVRANSASYRRAVLDIVHLAQEHVRLPCGKRVIIECDHTLQETGIAPYIIENCNGTMHKYSDVSLTNAVGEADIGALYYMNKFQQGYTSKYQDFTSGGILLRSVDTDYFPLTLTRMALHNDWHVILMIAKPYMSNNGSEFCSKNTSGAVMYHELYNIRKMITLLLHYYEPPYTREQVLSFTALCYACGNDYVDPLHGITHTVMFQVYKYMANQGYTLVQLYNDKPVLMPGAFVAFLLLAYARVYSIIKKFDVYMQPIHIGLLVNKSRMRKKVEARLPSIERQCQMYKEIQWCLEYTF